MTVDRGIELFVGYLRARNYSPCTIQAYRQALSAFARWLEEAHILRVGQVDRDLIDLYQHHVVHRTKRGGRLLSVSTQFALLIAVKGLFAFLVKRGDLLLNPAQHLPLPRRRRRQVPHDLPTVKEVEQILMEVDTRRSTGLRNRAALELLYSTGLRISELAGLKTWDVDAVEGIVTVQCGKGQKARLVPVGYEACWWVQRYLATVRPAWTKGKATDLLFVSWWGRPLCPRVLLDVLKTLARRVGVKKHITLHTLRHACASHMLARGADLRALQLLLGHEQLSTTALYTHLDLAQLKRVHQRCHPRACERQELPPRSHGT